MKNKLLRLLFLSLFSYGVLSCSAEKRDPAAFSESEKQRLNRGIVELSQKLQDTELQLQQTEAALAEALERLEQLESTESTESLVR